ncbi:MAG: hypothetical protein AABY07_06615, partial [Nanoarchaeota archaeon]
MPTAGNFYKRYEPPISAITEGFKQYKKIGANFCSKKGKAKRFLEAVNKEMVKELLNGKQIRLPFSMGTLRIEKHKVPFNKRRFLYFDFKKFNETGKKFYFLNEHRDGYYYKIKWIKGNSIDLFPYAFFPVRTFKRTLAKKLLTEDNIDYPEYTKTYKTCRKTHPSALL